MMTMNVIPICVYWCGDKQLSRGGICVANLIPPVNGASLGRFFLYTFSNYIKTFRFYSEPTNNIISMSKMTIAKLFPEYNNQWTQGMMFSKTVHCKDKHHLYYERLFCFFYLLGKFLIFIS